MRIANRAAGIKVTKFGTAAVTRSGTVRIGHAARRHRRGRIHRVADWSPRSTGPGSPRSSRSTTSRTAPRRRTWPALEIDDYLDKREFLVAARDPGGWTASIEAILHQGACSDTMETDGRYVMENNYAYSKALFDWCQDEEVPLIYASSAAVYGAGQGVRRGARERGSAQRLRVLEVPVRPVRAQATHSSERSAQVAGLRYFNVYGPNEAHKGRMASVAFHAFNQFRAEGRVKLFVGSDGYERRRAAARFRPRGRRGRA